MKPTIIRPTWKRHLRGWLPPLLVRYLERRWRGVRYVGDYPDWAAARRASSGYEAPEILARVAAATRLVRAGQAAYERDGVAFTEPSYAWPALACLLRAAARHDGRLDVLDFGGALGGLYDQHRAWWRGLRAVRWTVVEQPDFVELGRRELANEALTFCPTMADVFATGRPTVALFSGVVAWLPDPHAVLAQVVEAGVETVVIDRTPVIPGGRDRLTVQLVAPGLGRASYPCWFLARERLERHFAADYACAVEFPAFDPPAAGAEFRGFCFERRRR